MSDAPPTAPRLDDELARAVAADLAAEHGLRAPARPEVRHGAHHAVVLLPGHAVVRIARLPADAALLPRRCSLLQRLPPLGGVPLPRPLGEVRRVRGLAAVVQAWVPGRRRSVLDVEPERLAGLLRSLASIDVAPLAEVLAEPHAYGGGSGWLEELRDAAGLLPSGVRDRALRLVDRAARLPPVAPTLTHGDLHGENLVWSEEGVGVLDWDLTAAWDPAVDVACLVGSRRDLLEGLVPGALLDRADAWRGTFVLEQVVAARLRGEDPETVGRYAARAAAWLESAKAQALDV